MKNRIFNALLLIIICILFVTCNDDPTSPNNTTETTPIITAVLTNPLKLKEIFKITGSKFGSKRDSSNVMINNRVVDSAYYQKWSDTLITLILPAWAQNGDLYIKKGNTESNKVNIEIYSDPYSGIPIITKFEPDYCFVGDTIFIHGKNFGAYKPDSCILYKSTLHSSNIIVSPNTWNDTLITHIVSFYYLESTVADQKDYFNVKVGLKYSNSLGIPVLFNPKIDSISPKTVSTNTEITVYGSSLKYYDNKLSNENPELYLNDKKIENIILYEPNRIIFHLPENANSGYLKAKRFNKISNSIYLNVIEQPTIKNISPESGRAGTIISINGNNFSNSPGKVFFNSTEAEIISWEETNIVCKAPSNIPSTYLYILVDGMKSNSVFFNYTDTPSIGDYQLSKVDVHSFDPSGYNFTDLLQNYGNLSFGFKLFKPNNPFTKSSCTITFDSQSLNIKEAIIKYTYFEVGQGPIVYCKTTDIVITARDISPQTYSENTIDYQIGPEYADRITITFQSKFEWENLKTGERGTNYDSGVNDPKKMSPFYFHFY